MFPFIFYSAGSLLCSQIEEMGLKALGKQPEIKLNSSPKESEPFSEWMTYDALTISQKAQILRQEELKLNQLCDCQLDKYQADLYLTSRAAIIQRGKLDDEYSNELRKQYRK